jgi:hypothetical protein
VRFGDPPQGHPKRAPYPGVFGAAYARGMAALFFVDIFSAFPDEEKEQFASTVA